MDSVLVYALRFLLSEDGTGAEISFTTEVSTAANPSVIPATPVSTAADPSVIPETPDEVLIRQMDRQCRVVVTEGVQNTNTATNAIVHGVPSSLADDEELEEEGKGHKNVRKLKGHGFYVTAHFNMSYEEIQNLLQPLFFMRSKYVRTHVRTPIHTYFFVTLQIRVLGVMKREEKLPPPPHLLP